MMDLGTMQSKMDNREYRDMDQVEVSHGICQVSLWY